ncbi:transmembrane protein, putative, partial (macronuclear) [Tetrahymena thermophila SB210]
LLMKKNIKLNLKILSLSYNLLGKVGWFDFGTALAKCKKLSNLTLNLMFTQTLDGDIFGLVSGLKNGSNISNITFKKLQKQFIYFFILFIYYLIFQIFNILLQYLL